jgi:hypothetical protein
VGDSFSFTRHEEGYAKHWQTKRAVAREKERANLWESQGNNEVAQKRLKVIVVMPGRKQGASVGPGGRATSPRVILNHIMHLKEKDGAKRMPKSLFMQLNY